MTLENNSSTIHVDIKSEVRFLENNEMQYSIKELRARNNETQAAVAKSIGITTQTYCAWEKDISGVAVSKVSALARHFKVKLSQIKID